MRRQIWPCLALLGLIFLLAPTPPASADEKPHKLTVTAFATPGTPWDTDWQTFRQHIESHAGDRLRLKLLIRGEAGGEPIMISNIRRNRTQFGGFTLSGAAAVIPELAVLTSPYLFASEEELDFVMDEYMMEALQPLFAAKGLVLMRWAETGWLNMYGRKALILPQDAKGYRLRSQASIASQVLVRSIGGDLLQMPFQDLIPALQTGLVFGGETNVILYSLTGIAGEAPHYVMTRHSYDTGVVLASKKWFDALPGDLQQIVADAFPPSPVSRRAVRGMSRQLEKSLSEKNVQLHELTPEQRAAWVAATRDNHIQIIRRAGGRSQEIYDIVLAARRSYRAAHAENGAENGAADSHGAR
ncbi:MAG: TRAP transporter substrate-binding protein DctP [Proteobacteria bacterium]|nr:TRAP transporter substrate-binding protein DctP [Pseudomonadota bacterium]